MNGVERQKRQPIDWKLVKAREALGKHWQESFDNGFRGRTWGSKKNPENPFYGSNITFAKGDEIVVVNQNKEGKIKIQGFSRNEDSSLAKEVSSLLKNEGLID